MEECQEDEKKKEKNKINEIEIIKDKISNTNNSNFKINNTEINNEQKFYFYKSDSSTNISNNVSNSNFNDSSTFDNSKSNISNTSDSNNLTSFSDNNYQTLKQFNSIRTKYYDKNKLYDLTPALNYKIINLPSKYKINEKHSAYLYENNLYTYTICISGFLVKDGKNIFPFCNIENNDIFNETLGLFFCGKNIEIKNEIGINKNCKPNEFMCKECMQKNKKLYNIKSKYLININGRAAKINKGSYHCFGKFLIGNQIEDCINKFSCMACKLLDQYSMYYQ